MKCKGKGSGFERDVSKTLSKYIQGTEKPYLFWRTPLSGGLATIDLLNKALSGDIRSISEKSKWFTDIFTIECKTGYKRYSIDKHLKNLKIDILKDFWLQTIRQSKELENNPMLIFQKHGLKDPWLGIDYICIDKLHKHINSLKYVKIVWVDIPDIYVFNFNDFLKCVSHVDMKKTFKKG